MKKKEQMKSESLFFLRLFRGRPRSRLEEVYNLAYSIGSARESNRWRRQYKCNARTELLEIFSFFLQGASLTHMSWFYDLWGNSRYEKIFVWGETEERISTEKVGKVNTADNNNGGKFSPFANKSLNTLSAHCEKRRIGRQTSDSRCKKRNWCSSHPTKNRIVCEVENDKTNKMPTFPTTFDSRNI